MLKAKIPLLPCATQRNKHTLKLLLAMKDNFKGSCCLRENSATIIPCTERSSSRAGVRPVNHPLCDKLQYLAEILRFWRAESLGFAKDPSEPYRTFMEELEEWEHHRLAIQRLVQF